MATTPGTTSVSPSMGSIWWRSTPRQRRAMELIDSLAASGTRRGLRSVGADAGHFEARLDGAGGAGGFAGPGIDQDDMAAGLDEQAGIRAEHAVGREVMAFHGAAELGGVGVGKEPGRRVRVVAVA